MQKERRQDLPFKKNRNRFLNVMFGGKTRKRTTVEAILEQLKGSSSGIVWHIQLRTLVFAVDR